SGRLTTKRWPAAPSSWPTTWTRPGWKPAISSGPWSGAGSAGIRCINWGMWPPAGSAAPARKTLLCSSARASPWPTWPWAPPSTGGPWKPAWAGPSFLPRNDPEIRPPRVIVPVGRLLGHRHVAVAEGHREDGVRGGQEDPVVGPPDHGAGVQPGERLPRRPTGHQQAGIGPLR